MNKRRNFRNWIIVVLIMITGLVLSAVGLNRSNWPVRLLMATMVALISYWALARLRVL